WVATAAAGRSFRGASPSVSRRTAAGLKPWQPGSRVASSPSPEPGGDMARSRTAAAAERRPKGIADPGPLADHLDAIDAGIHELRSPGRGAREDPRARRGRRGDVVRGPDPDQGPRRGSRARGAAAEGASEAAVSADELAPGPRDVWLLRRAALACAADLGRLLQNERRSQRVTLGRSCDSRRPDQVRERPMALIDDILAQLSTAATNATTHKTSTQTKTGQATAATDSPPACLEGLTKLDEARAEAELAHDEAGKAKQLLSVLSLGTLIPPPTPA